MAKKERERGAAPPANDPTTKDDDAIDVPTLLWALGILAILVILQRLIWGE